jgi:hypothetical protein
MSAGTDAFSCDAFESAPLNAVRSEDSAAALSVASARSGELGAEVDATCSTATAAFVVAGASRSASQAPHNTAADAAPIQAIFITDPPVTAITVAAEA